MALPCNLNRFGSGNKRKYYCEVEYIQSHVDSERIETGIYFDSSKDIDVEMIVYLPSGNTASRWLLIGDHLTGTSSTNLEMTKNGTNADKLRMYLNRGGSDRYSSVMSDYEDKTIKFKFTHTADNNYYEATLNGRSLTRTYNTAYSNTANPLSFFRDFRASPNNIFGGYRIYSCKIKQDGVLARDYVPVLDWNMTPCLYDKVNNTLTYNTGSGTLNYGRQIHYVPYIHSTGTQYINTGIVPSVSIITEIKVQPYNTNETVLGSGTTTDVLSDRYQIVASSSNRYTFRYRSNAVTGPSGVLLNVASVCKIDPVNKKTWVNDVSVSMSASEYTFTNPIYIFCGSRNAGETLACGTEDVYYCKIWDNTTLIRDLRAAIDENGVGFMIDCVEHVIHDNAGTGAFEYPDVELEYLEADGDQYIETNYTATANSGVDIDYAYQTISSSDRAGVFGILKGSSPRQDCLFISTYSGYTSSRIYLASRGGTLDTNVFPVQYQFYNVKINWLNSGKINFNNGEQSANVGSNTPQTTTFRLFARYNAANASWANAIARLKTVKISEGTNIAMIFVPVYHNGVACMYDRISQTYFTNAGTGSFGTKIKEKR